MVEYRYKSEENSGNTGNAAREGKIVFAAPVVGKEEALVVK